MIFVVSFQIPANTFFMLKVYNVLGNKVATLVNEEKPGGSMKLKFLQLI